MTKMVNAPEMLRDIMAGINSHTLHHPPTVQTTKTRHTIALDRADRLVLGKRSEGNVFNVMLVHADGTSDSHGPVCSREGAKVNAFLNLKRRV
jgi:hypothetical protein